MRRPVSGRSAFTLTELLILCGIAALFLGILLPAILKAREASARLECADNLKRIGLAFHQYHDARSSLPHGGTHTPPAGTADPGSRREWSWAYHILPYLAQEHVYKSADHVAVDTTPIRTYYCPARRPPSPGPGGAGTDYAGNAGDDRSGGWANGVVVRGPDDRIRLGDVSDGACHTVLAAEKQLNRAMLGMSTDDNEPYPRPGWNGDFEVYRRGDRQPARDTSHEGAVGPSERFGSSHRVGFNAVFCDGTVRHVRFGISLIPWTRACLRNDGVTCSADDL